MVLNKLVPSMCLPEMKLILVCLSNKSKNRETFELYLAAKYEKHAFHFKLLNMSDPPLLGQVARRRIVVWRLRHPSEKSGFC